MVKCFSKHVFCSETNNIVVKRHLLKNLFSMELRISDFLVKSEKRNFKTLKGFNDGSGDLRVF